MKIKFSLKGSRIYDFFQFLSNKINIVRRFNPIRALEPKHILFYYQQIVWLYNAGVAGYVKLKRRTRCR